MLDSHTAIYTTKGWLKYDEVQPGDVTISFNDYRHCTEYDVITSIRTTEYDGPILTLEGMSVCQRMTPDHMIKMHRRTKWVYRSAGDMFFARCREVLQNELFEPYRVTKDIEDVKWAARLAAHFVNYRSTPEEVLKDIKYYSSDLCGYEAHEWISTFYGWVLRRPYRKGFRAACFVNNPEIKELLWDIAPRAGVGALFKSDVRMAGNWGSNWKMHITGPGYAELSNTCWKRDHLQGEVYDLETSNGTFLSKTHGRISLATCKRGEK